MPLAAEDQMCIDRFPRTMNCCIVLQRLSCTYLTLLTASSILHILATAVFPLLVASLLLGM